MLVEMVRTSRCDSLPRARAALKQMNRDTEHLRLLAIFHYVAAGLAAFFSFFPLLYATIGGIFIFVSRHGTPKPGEELPPEFVGWIFVGLGLVLFLLGIAMSICILIAGRCLSARKAYPSRSSWLASNVSSFLSEQFSAYLRLWRCRENLLGRYFRQDNRERENRAVGFRALLAVEIACPWRP